MDLSPLDQALGRIFGGTGTPDSRDAAEQGARDEIAEAFALIRTLPAARVAVPCVEVKFNGIARAARCRWTR
jgi:transketolase C-terminal domain/subunit